MARSKETSGKKEITNKRVKKRKEKELRKIERKEQGKKSFDEMIAWVDENGMLTNTQPDLTLKKEIKVETIEIGIPKEEFRINNNKRSGSLKNFNDEKGFGFIQDSESKELIFVHTSDCVDALKVGCKVKFETEKSLKGLKAVRVKLL